LTGLGTQFAGFGQIGIAAGETWTLPGSFTGGPAETTVNVAAGDTVTTTGGTIRGGGGIYGFSGGPGGAGSAAIALAANDSLTNYDMLVGGVGGAAASIAGNGGLGLSVSVGDNVINHGTILGGIGNNPNVSGEGGTGGSAVTLVGGTLTNEGVVTGGAGGRDTASGLSGNAGFSAAGGMGIGLAAGATVINDGTVTGGFLGGGATINGGTLLNNLYIAGGYRGNGAQLSNGASLTNSATITGGFAYGNALVAGAVPGPVGNGVALTSGSALTNLGTITAGLGGAGAALNDSTMINDLVLTGGQYGDGASLTAGATLTNNGRITGGGASAVTPSAHGGSGAGVALAVGSTLTNDGTIAGGEIADGVYLTTSASLTNLGLIQSGQSFNDGKGAFPAAGVFLTAGALVSNVGTILGGSSAAGAYVGGGILINTGTIDAGTYTAGVTLNGGTLVNAGTIAGRASFIVTEPPSTGPTGNTYPGGTYTVPAFAAVQFGSLAGDLVIGSGAVFEQDIAGFVAGDTIDLQNVLFGSTPTLTASTDALTISGDGNSVTLDLAGAAADQFKLTIDAAGTGTDLVIPCFRAGTRIASEGGETAVEDLKIGDLVALYHGGVAPIVWIGRRRVDATRHPNPSAIWPVRIRAGAFGEHLPKRDLFLSPDHAVYVDEMLIPVKSLINGTSIARLMCDDVTYYHVELARHDVLLAEGLSCESFLDTGGKRQFEASGVAIALYPDFSTFRWEAEGCAPLIVTGRKFDEVRRRLNAIATIVDRRTLAA
jgi:hypothetical protein